MKIKLNSRELSKHLTIASKAISNRTTMEILDGFLLEAKEDKLKITSTDLEISIETTLNCDVIEEGSIVMDSRLFSDIIRRLPDDIVNIDVKDMNMNIKCLHSEFNLMGKDPELYPDLPVIIRNESFTLKSDIIKNSIRQTVFATSIDLTRIQLTGVLIEVSEEDISFVAVDGYRLAIKKIDKATGLNLKMIVPGRVLSELEKLLSDDSEEITISSAPGNIVFELGDTTVYSRLLDGNFFNYKDIIRENHETTFTVDRMELQRALERASLMAKEGMANLLKLNIADGKLVINSNSKIGDVHEEIFTDIIGGDVTIAFNSRYLLEGIRAIETEKVELNFVGRLNPAIIHPIDGDNYTYLVLPVRINKN